MAAIITVYLGFLYKWLAYGRLVNTTPPSKLVEPVPLPAARRKKAFSPPTREKRGILSKSFPEQAKQSEGKKMRF